MKTLSKLSVILWITDGILLLLLITVFIDTPKDNQILEIYTHKDIIYIDDLCVFFEVRQDTLCFAAHEHLNDFVSSMTADHVLEHRSEILKSNRL